MILEVLFLFERMPKKNGIADVRKNYSDEYISWFLSQLYQLRKITKPQNLRQHLTSEIEFTRATKSRS